MKQHVLKSTLAVLVLAVFAGVNARAAEVTVTVKNLTHGIYFTPFLITAHDGDTHLFRLGEAASFELTQMAEGGDISGLSALVGGADMDTKENPAGGLLGPGEMTPAVSLDTTQTGNMYISLVAMMLPTNDGFVGLDAMMIPSEPGTYSYYLNGYDAGTEANDELITGGGAVGAPGIPAAPGGDGGRNGMGVAGADANTMVHVHRGVLGDTNPNAGMSDLDSTIHRWLNPVAEVVFEIK